VKHPNRQAGWQEAGSGNGSVVGSGSSVTVAGGQHCHELDERDEDVVVVAVAGSSATIAGSSATIAGSSETVAGSSATVLAGSSATVDGSSAVALLRPCFVPLLVVVVVAMAAFFTTYLCP
jgi:hypothetical protein